MSRSHNNRRASLPMMKTSVFAVGLALAGSATAAQFELENGLKGSLDTTISYGVSVRAEAPSADLIGIANGGTTRSVNEDDGNRNYVKNRPFSSLLKVTQDLDMKYGDWGFFARGLYFIDFDAYHNSKLGPIAKERLGADAKILDAFIARGFDVGGKNLRFRLGQQVISWGESTFIPNGINIINPVDVSKLRVPGSELKEAFIPTKSLWGSLELSKNASMEAFVLFNFDKTKLDPRGSYWSNNDTASDDANHVILSFARRNDLTGRLPTNPIPPTTPTAGPLAQSLYGVFDTAAAVWAPRGNDRDASDHGQYGVAFRYLATELNNTEFALYYTNYHSRIPFFSGIKGTPTSILTGGPLATAVGQTGTASYFVEYPEDIKMYGVSFNTGGPFGIALQGEVSYRPNQPLQLASTELILAALGAPNLVTGFETIPGTVSATAPFGASPAALVPNGTLLTGWRRVKQMQAQLTATKSFPAVLGSEQAVLVGEFGYTKYGSLPTGQKFNAPATYLPATAQGAVAGQAGSVQPGGYLTENSWGYRIAARAEYANMLFGGNLAPRLAWSHDVKGVSGTFNEGVKSVSVGLNLEVKKQWSFDLSYTSFFGGRTYCGTDQVTNAGQTALAAQLAGVAALGIRPQPASWCSSANGIHDRDFYSAVVSYSF
ncbi:MAG: DUF1302 domain-containing protein [Betaproteobacteria bacterium]|nr:DUF1302 domain-containing protein [Betaproteobacteria bacterium]